MKRIVASFLTSVSLLFGFPTFATHATYGIFEPSSSPTSGFSQCPHNGLFTFRNGVSANMTMNDVITTERRAPDKRQEDRSEVTGNTLIVLSYSDVCVGGFSAELSYHFWNDDLWRICYTFPSLCTNGEVNNEGILTLLQALISKYGNPYRLSDHFFEWYIAKLTISASFLDESESNEDTEIPLVISYRLPYPPTSELIAVPILTHVPPIISTPTPSLNSEGV